MRVLASDKICRTIAFGLCKVLSYKVPCYTHYRQKISVKRGNLHEHWLLEVLWHIVYAYHLESAFLAFFVGKW